jgi:RimJ/RimL family protein N-acetyltransferase
VTARLRPVPYTLHDLCLRAPQPGDAAARFALGRNPANTRMYGLDPATLPAWTMAAAEAWVDRVAKADCAWIIAYQSRLVGEVRLHSHMPEEGSAKLAIGIEDITLLGRGLGRRVIALVLDCAFACHGLGRVTARVLAMNTRAIACYTACGFRHTGRDPNAVQLDGIWHDDILMAITAEDFFAQPRSAELHSPTPSL